MMLVAFPKVNWRSKSDVLSLILFVQVVFSGNDIDINS